MVIRRKVEIHRLIISGLPQDEEYGALLRRIRQRVSRLQDLVLAYGSRSHLLYSAATTTRGRMRMRFISYTTGFRPDIFDTQSFSLGQNPLGANQTGVDWTQVIGGDVRNRYLLAVERGRNLTAPGTIERYLQWLLGAYYEPELDDEDEPITVTLEAEAGQEFITRLNDLTRITRATVRTARPNPGWQDLESELARQSQESDARKNEVSMISRRGASLRKNAGIVAAIRGLFHDRRLDYAAIEGEKDGQRQKINTKNLVRSTYVDFGVDDRGQVVPEDAWRKLTRILDTLE